LVLVCHPIFVYIIMFYVRAVLLAAFLFF